MSSGSVTVEDKQSQIKKFKESARNHWKCVREAIRDGCDEENWIHFTIQDYLTIIGYHYMTAMEHGYKHGIYDGSLTTITPQESKGEQS
uniref:Uncharacterized protein n=1 Tax=viral metagenome TaxID=1070528 RepID=A0A6M3X4I5_9ZZZZ